MEWNFARLSPSHRSIKLRLKLALFLALFLINATTTFSFCIPLPKLKEASSMLDVFIIFNEEEKTLNYIIED